MQRHPRTASRAESPRRVAVSSRATPSVGVRMRNPTCSTVVAGKTTSGCKRRAKLGVNESAVRIGAVLPCVSTVAGWCQHVLPNKSKPLHTSGRMPTEARACDSRNFVKFRASLLWLLEAPSLQQRKQDRGLTQHERAVMMGSRAPAFQTCVLFASRCRSRPQRTVPAV